MTRDVHWMGLGHFVCALALASVGVGCDPSESDYVDQAFQDFAARSREVCCDEKCVDAEAARCTFVKDARIVKSVVNTTQGRPGKLHEVVLDVEGPGGKGRCTFHYWNTGSTIQRDTDMRGEKCVGSASP